MYARELAEYLHRRLGELHDFNGTLNRFESLRSHGLLPRGRENAAVRLSDEQIASAVFCFAATRPGWAGHVALILGKLKPVGGASASFVHGRTLRESVAALVSNEKQCCQLISLTLSVDRMDHDYEYHARLIFKEDGKRKISSYVSSMACNLLSEGAEETFDHYRPRALSARELTFGSNYFLQLHRRVSLSRYSARPLRTDWREYENEEARNLFHARLGARNNSRFFNVGVDTTVTWPSEPTSVAFGGHNLVLFPKTEENAHSVSIDVANEEIDLEDARTLINRFLSLLSWCDDQHAILRHGWAGNRVPVPVRRRNLAFETAHTWVFDRKLPVDEDLLQRLAYYREALNAREAAITTYEVLSFYKVFEARNASPRGVPNPTREWINGVFPHVTQEVRKEILDQFNKERKGKDVGSYIVENCRVATAHASERYPSDADADLELRRLAVAADILRALARYYLHDELAFSDSWFEVESRSK